MFTFEPVHFIKMSRIPQFPQRGEGRHERIGSSSHCGCAVFNHISTHSVTDVLNNLLIHSSACHGTVKPECNCFPLVFYETEKVSVAFHCVF